jgi:hypothetical protein
MCFLKTLSKFILQPVSQNVSTKKMQNLDKIGQQNSSCFTLSVH